MGTIRENCDSNPKNRNRNRNKKCALQHRTGITSGNQGDLGMKQSKTNISQRKRN